MHILNEWIVKKYHVTSNRHEMRTWICLCRENCSNHWWNWLDLYGIILKLASSIHKYNKIRSLLIIYYLYVWFWSIAGVWIRYSLAQILDFGLCWKFDEKFRIIYHLIAKFLRNTHRYHHFDTIFKFNVLVSYN